MVDRLIGAIFRLRHRKSRSEIVAFAMGIRVGREMNHMTDGDVDKMINGLLEDYS